jgi:hypothetical protein
MSLEQTIEDDRPDATRPSAVSATRPRKKGAAAQWLTALLPVLVSAIPIAVGIYLLVELSSGHVIPETVRHLASPIPVVLHVVSAAAYATFGAFQFVAAFRRRFPAGIDPQAGFFSRAGFWPGFPGCG